MAFIEVEHLTFSYDSDGGSDALRDFSFSVGKGEFVAVLGHNGSGKSTLAKLLSLVLESTEGKIVIDGITVSSDMSEKSLVEIRQKVGMVFQNPDDQIVATVVEEDIAFGPENLGIEPSLIRKRVDDALDAVSMTEYARHAPHRLSGGQKQRIAIAGVLAMRPQCIIFDEATAMLDPKGRADIMELVKKIHGEGITVIFITHNMDEAAMADRIIVLDKGSLYMEGTPKEIFSNAEKLYSAGLEIPEVTLMSMLLSEGGLNTESVILDEDELVEQIALSLKGE